MKANTPRILDDLRLVRDALNDYAQELGGFRPLSYCGPTLDSARDGIEDIGDVLTQLEIEASELLKQRDELRSKLEWLIKTGGLLFEANQLNRVSHWIFFEALEDARAAVKPRKEVKP